MRENYCYICFQYRLKSEKREGLIRLFQLFVPFLLFTRSICAFYLTRLVRSTCPIATDLFYLPSYARILLVRRLALFFSIRAFLCNYLFNDKRHWKEYCQALPFIIGNEYESCVKIANKWRIIGAGFSRKKKKGNCISVHIFLLGRTGGDKSGSGARLNKKNSAGLISKERTGARQSANYSPNLGNHPYKLDTLNPTATHRAQKNCLTTRKLLAVSFKSATKPESPSKKKKKKLRFTLSWSHSISSLIVSLFDSSNKARFDNISRACFPRWTRFLLNIIKQKVYINCQVIDLYPYYLTILWIVNKVIII